MTRFSAGAVVLLAALLAACPLPFEFVPKNGGQGVIGSDDPANPSTTAAPTMELRSQVTGEAVTRAETDVFVYLESETPGSVIYYLEIDGPLPEPLPIPLPGQVNTAAFSPSSPIEVEGHLTTKSIVAIAIGPNMYPSTLFFGEVQVAYEMAATPAFSPAGGTSASPATYATDIAVTINAPDAGAEIWYTMVSGTGPAPDPVPGSVGSLYTGPIQVSGAGTIQSFAAVSVVDQKENSFVERATYQIVYPGLAINDGDGWISIAENGAGISVVVSGAASPGMTYQVTGITNAAVTPVSGAYAGNLVLSLTAAGDGAVAITVTLTDAIGNTLSLSDTSNADLTPPGTPQVVATSNGNTVDPAESGTLPNRTLFADNLIFNATSGGGGGGGLEYRTNTGSGWSAWTPVVPVDVPITAGAPSGGVRNLEVELREQDGVGNLSSAAYRIFTVDRRAPTATITVTNSVLDKEVRVVFFSRNGGVAMPYHIIITDTLLITMVDEQSTIGFAPTTGTFNWIYDILGGAIISVDVWVQISEIDLYGNSSQTVVVTY